MGPYATGMAAAAGRAQGVGGLGHYFMENPQGLEGRHGSQNSCLLKNRILGWSCPFHRHPPTLPVIPEALLISVRLGLSCRAWCSPMPGRAGFLPDSLPLLCPVALRLPYALSQRQECSMASPGGPHGRGKTVSLGVFPPLVGLSLRAWHAELEVGDVHSACGRWHEGVFCC